MDPDADPEAQKYMDPTAPDPNHWFFASHLFTSSLEFKKNIMLSDLNLPD